MEWTKAFKQLWSLLSSLRQFEADVTAGRAADHKVEAQGVSPSLGLGSVEPKWRQLSVSPVSQGPWEHTQLPQQCWWGCCSLLPAEELWLCRSSHRVGPSFRSAAEHTIASTRSAGMELALPNSVPHPHSYCGIQLSASYSSLCWWWEAELLPSWRWSQGR